MAGIDEVLERLVTDPAFRARLAAGPDGALSGYTLSGDDHAVLATALSTDAGISGTVERRINRTALAGITLDSVAGGQAPEAAEDADTDASDAATPAGDITLARMSDEPHPVDRALLESLEGWFARAAADQPVNATDVGAALGIGSEPLAGRVLTALDGERDGWTGREYGT